MIENEMKKAGMIAPHEPEEELVTIEDVREDVRSLREGIAEAGARRLAREILAQERISKLLDEVVAVGICGSQAEALERALESFFVAVLPPERRLAVGA